MSWTFRPLLPVTLAGLLLLPAACDRAGGPFEGLSIRTPPPDEFSVMPRRPLAMPPGLGLPPPRPGAPSPLDVNPGREAEIALLGGPVARPTSRQTTQGEAALLRTANATQASNDIRVELARDNLGADEPYEAPTIFELFGMDGGESRARLDPQAEARRLQQSGVAAPSDPEAEPEVEQPQRGRLSTDADDEPFTVYRAPRQALRP